MLLKEYQNKNIKNFFKNTIKKFGCASILLEFFRFLKNPNEQLIILNDYTRTKKITRFIRNNKFVINDAKIVLIPSISDHIYEVKCESMLALGLKIKGWRVVVLTSKTHYWTRRYFELFGIKEFVYWEDIKLNKQEESECKSVTREFLQQSFSFQKVKSWKYKWALIGPQILSSIFRNTYQVTLDLKDKLIKESCTRLLSEVIKIVLISEKILNLINPKMLLMIEPNYALMGALTDTAIMKKINVIRFCQPNKDDALTFIKLTDRTRRFHPSSVLKETFQNADFLLDKNQETELMKEFENRYNTKWFLQSRNQPGVKQKKKSEIMKELQLIPSKKIAVIFSHVLWDANLFFGDDLFDDYGDWFVQTIRAACNNKNVNWIVKLHPANLWKRAYDNVDGELAEIKLIKKIGALPEHVKLLYPHTEISAKSLFDIADYVITVRGTAGMEAPCFGVVTFTAGTGRYSGLGFTNDSNTKEEYLRKLAIIHKYKKLPRKKIILAKKHAYIAFCRRQWRMKSFKAIFKYKKRGFHRLDHNLLLNVNSIGMINQNQDLAKWALWAEDKNKIEYLE